MNYETTLQGWHDFYSLTGTAAASLVGLLFVGLSLHLRVVITHPDVRALARVTMTTFGVSLILALFMLVPEHDPASTGQELIGLGVVALLLIGPSLISGVRSGERTLGFRRLILRFGLGALTFAALIAIGGVLIGGEYQTSLPWLVGVAVFLLVSSLRNSWELLVSVGQATLIGHTPPEAAPAPAAQPTD
jgi:hypothetical protein